jgi:hypothetical protein
VPVVVVRVTPHQGERESRLQGEGAQMVGHDKIGRYAKCRAPKRCWVSSVNADLLQHSRHKPSESRMLGNSHVRFGGGPLEKDQPTLAPRHAAYPAGT